MIELIFEMLHLTDHLGHSELIEIAKGKNELPTTFEKIKEQSKRAKAWQRLKKQ